MLNVSVIGFGNVGSVLSKLFLNNDHAIRLNVMEPDDQKEGAFLDLTHSMPLYPNKEMKVNDEDLFLKADFIFFTAGVPNEHGGSRLSTVEENKELSQEIFESKHFSENPYIIIISNPVDIFSNAVYKYSGLGAERIIGTGTFLDSIRLSHYLSSLSNYSSKDFESWVLGEHGSTQVPVFTSCKLKGKPLVDYSDSPQRNCKKSKRRLKMLHIR